MTVTPVPDAAIIVVAAGSGMRLGAGAPKAFVGLDAHTVLWHSLLPIFGARRAAQVVLVVPPGLEGNAQTEAMDAAATVARRGEASDRFELVSVVAGGATRQASVAAGLRAVWPSVATVLVHDAARSLTPSEMFDRVIEEVERTGSAVIPGLPVVDTVKRVAASGAVGDTVDRDTLLAVQTPQGFRRDVLDAAYASATGEFTDDAALVAAAGHPVRGRREQVAHVHRV
ncbi:MAG TPA: IspD/TarI family cytidylyltransferase, partial [Microbacteriaceae bacterium]|nr:IspD/TarI family cytidylyltransferase [Microbacteriaceae bacterium]